MFHRNTFNAKAQDITICIYENMTETYQAGCPVQMVAGNATSRRAYPAAAPPGTIKG